jgi:hypothetical protein
VTPSPSPSHEPLVVELTSGPLRSSPDLAVALIGGGTTEHGAARRAPEHGKAWRSPDPVCGSPNSV